MAKQSKVDRTGIYRFQDDGHYREAPLVDTRRHAPTDWDRDEFADLVLVADTTSQRILKSQGYTYTARADEEGVPAIVRDAREVLDLIYQLSLTDDGEFIYVDPARAWHIGAAFQRLMARTGEPLAVRGAADKKSRQKGSEVKEKRIAERDATLQECVAYLMTKDKVKRYHAAKTIHEIISGKVQVSSCGENFPCKTLDIDKEFRTKGDEPLTEDLIHRRTKDP